MLNSALVQSRASLVGPFQGATLPFAMPQPLDTPNRLAYWAAERRLQVCALDLRSGLQFEVDQSALSVSLNYVDLNSSTLTRRKLTELCRPPAETFGKQLDLVSNYAELRSDRGPEILAQLVPQVPFWGSIIGLQPHRHSWTLELIGLALGLTSDVEMRFKHAFACPRPMELSPQIQPMIATPGHGSWPSGHATEAYMVSTLLQALLPSGDKYKEQLERQAARIAVNRTVAGLHYPVDSAAGRLLGTSLAEFFVARCLGSADVHWRGFAGSGFQRSDGSAIDFDPRVALSDNSSGYYEIGAAVGPISASPLLRFMWEKARKEWAPVE